MAGLRTALWGLALLGAVPARAQESLDEAAAAPAPPSPSTSGLAMGSTEGKATAEVNGYLDNRLQLGWARVGGLIPTDDLPTISDLLEANIQLKVRALQSLSLHSDLSLFLQAGGLYFTAATDGSRLQLPEHDVASLRPMIVPSELYLSWRPAEWLRFTLGKRRITWGAGLAQNPTDLLNPPKDPTDPTFQRAGAWVAQVEAPLRRVTLTALFSPSVLYQQSGLPYAFLVYPSYPTAESGLPLAGYAPPDKDAHFLGALRLYALLASTDINLVYYLSNRYHDDADFRMKSRLGLSVSRFFGEWEVHVEALGQLGTTRRYADLAAVAAAGQGGPVTLDALLPQRDKDASRPVARVVAGTRHVFREESMLSLEYYYQGDGLAPGELSDYLRLLAAARAGGWLSRVTGGAPSGASAGALPQRFSFDPLRSHYLVAAWTKPRIADDWTVGLTVIVGLEDLSGLVSPTVSWQPREWLLLTATALVPFYGLPVGQACAQATSTDGRCPAGQAYSEFSLFPQDVRAYLQARLFY